MLRVDDYGDASGARMSDERRRVRERAFVIVLQHYNGRRRQQRDILFQERRTVVGRQRSLEIRAQKLLILADDAQLERRLPVRYAEKTAFDPGGSKARLKHVACGVLTHGTHQRHPRPETRDIQRHVGRAAGAFVDLFYIDDGDRCFR
jgi:hypothetical protein